MNEAIRALSAQWEQLALFETELDQQRRELTDARITSDRRIGELNAWLASRDQADLNQLRKAVTGKGVLGVRPIRK